MKLPELKGFWSAIQNCFGIMSVVPYTNFHK